MSVFDPLKRFFQDARAIGAVLVLCAVVSLLLSNAGPWQEAYRGFWSAGFDGTTDPHGHWGSWVFPNTPSLVINDGLMAIFFFLVGMEIKRELLRGELASAKQSLLPAMGAAGGMLAPALLFAFCNRNGQYLNGWAIPTATDIAFTLGMAGLLGKKIPVNLKIFVTALAIIDDLLAIAVIALFYGNELHTVYLLAAALVLLLLWLLNRYGKKFGIFHWLLGIVLWYCIYRSGIHATIAGVLFACMVPAHALSRYEHDFHLPVYFLVIPVFALANTAMYIPPGISERLAAPLSAGILAGLCIGKPLGILGACYLLVRTRMAALPRGVNWQAMVGGAILCGIGFTMSIFIASLAFNDPGVQDISKTAVMTASLISAVAGSVWLRFANTGDAITPQNKKG
ncbi:Na+/H+ antiporter NhaA [Sediminibacterium sp. WSJ-3]|nr:Na+/H+ antiporter NhaA [Sediminibacterium soli]